MEFCKAPEVAENHHRWLHCIMAQTSQQEVRILIQHNKMALIDLLRVPSRKQNVVKLFRCEVPVRAVPGGYPMLCPVEIDDWFGGAAGANPDMVLSRAGVQHI